MTTQEIIELKYLRIRIQKLLEDHGNNELTYNILEEFNRMYDRFLYQYKEEGNESIKEI